MSKHKKHISKKKKSKMRSRKDSSSSSTSSSSSSSSTSSTSSSSSSSSSTSSSSSASDYKYKKKLKYRKRARSSSSSSSFSSSSEDNRQKKRLKKVKHSIPKKKLKTKTKKIDNTKQNKSTDVPLHFMEKHRVLAPMTKEEWEKQQSIVKKVYDESTGRYRLIKGDGEVLEEIVSKDRHKQINQQATKGDGNYFQQKIGLSKIP